jgi:hypothetical protein
MNTTAIPMVSHAGTTPNSSPRRRRRLLNAARQAEVQPIAIITE